MRGGGIEPTPPPPKRVSNLPIEPCLLLTGIRGAQPWICFRTAALRKAMAAAQVAGLAAVPAGWGRPGNLRVLAVLREVPHLPAGGNGGAPAPTSLLHTALWLARAKCNQTGQRATSRGGNWDQTVINHFVSLHKRRHFLVGAVLGDLWNGEECPPAPPPHS